MHAAYIYVQFGETRDQENTSLTTGPRQNRSVHLFKMVSYV